MSNTRAVSMQDIADETGYSLMTVSRVIRGHGSASAKARKVIETCADTLGYDYNPEVSRMMSLMRSGQRNQYHETLGLLWFAEPALRKKNESLSKLEKGIQHRAEQLGYRLDPIEFSDYHEHPARLFDVLGHRGVRGVFLMPMVGSNSDHLGSMDFPWEDFAWVAFGNTHANQEFHRVGHHHFFGMELALQNLKRNGIKRPALYISDHLSDTVHHAYKGSFLSNHSGGIAEALRLIIPSDIGLKEITAWTRKHKADALITPHTNSLKSFANHLPPLVSLHVQDKDPYPGIDQQNRILGTYAVDMLVAQLHRNETGLPEEAKLMMNKGRWIEGSPK